jgi:hypothetical protein
VGHLKDLLMQGTRGQYETASHGWRCRTLSAFGGRHAKETEK